MKRKQPQTDSVTNLQGTYTDDYDIIQAYDTVINYLLSQETIQKEYQEKSIELHKQSLSSPNLTPLQRRYATQSIASAEQALCDIAHHTVLEDYKSKAQHWIDLYTKMGTRNKTIYFGVKSTKKDDPYTPYKLKVIEEFLNVTSNYIPVNIIRMPPPDNCCPGCGGDLSEMASDENGIQQCPQCSYERALLGRISSASNTAVYEPATRASRDTSDERENFIKDLDNYEGKQKTKFPDDLFDRLDEYFIMEGKPTGEMVRAGNSTMHISIPLMYKALAAVQRPLYEHVFLICHQYWGLPLADISHLRETILLHFDLTQDVARELGLPSINRSFRIMKHLEMVGVPINQSEWRIPKTRTIVEEDEETWETMISRCGERGRLAGLKHIPTI